MSCLWDSIAPSAAAIRGEFHGRGASVALATLASGSIFGTALESLRGLSVLIATREQLPTALALVELDGVARRMVLCTPDLSPEQLASVAATAEADAIVVDAGSTLAPSFLNSASLTPCAVTAQPIPGPVSRRVSEFTEWILLTSGTTGTPKLVLHTLQSLGGALPTQPPSGSQMVWSTFYDIRRYGGLQIYLRAVLSGSPLVLSYAGEPTPEFLARAAAAGVTHISGTPSHWRRALMSGEAAILKPQYVRPSRRRRSSPARFGFRGPIPSSTHYASTAKSRASRTTRSATTSLTGASIFLCMDRRESSRRSGSLRKINSAPQYPGLRSPTGLRIDSR